MEVENEEKKFISVTPCSSSVRKNLLSSFENSQDSGFFSNTPGSREQSHKSISNYLINRSHDYLLTPTTINDNEAEQITPNVICSNTYHVQEDYNIHHSSSYKKCDKQQMMDIWYSPIVPNTLKIDKSNNLDECEKSVYMDCEELLCYDDTKDCSLPSVVSERINNFKCKSESNDSSEKSERPIILNEPIINQTLSASPKIVKHRIERKKVQSQYILQRISLYGFEYVDFLYLLGEKYRYDGVVSKILSYLSVTDLINVSAVSKSWKQICFNDLNARKKLQIYKKACAAAKENLTKSGKEGRRRLGPRPLFSDIQNLQRSSPVKTSSPAHSPRTHRFWLFCREGEKLDKESKLMPCPRCTLPARCSRSESNLGQCLCENCQFKFCTKCFNSFHYSTPCRVPSCPTRSRQDMKIGSKASKRRLSRTMI